MPRSGASPLKPNQWYVDDLVGLALVNAGRRLAEVRSVLEGGAEPWLEVFVPGAVGQTPGNPERVAVVPFRKEFVGEVDLAAGTIELLVPELLSPELP